MWFDKFLYGEDEEEIVNLINMNGEAPREEVKQQVTYKFKNPYFIVRAAPALRALILEKTDGHAVSPGPQEGPAPHPEAD